MSQTTVSTAPTNPPPETAAPLHLVRLPVDKAQPAVDFLRQRSGGAMDLIAHFWERLEQTPPLSRPDLHLLAALPTEYKHSDINIQQLESTGFSGAMLYVPKGYRADVLALDGPTAFAFVAYIRHHATSNSSDSAAMSQASPPPADRVVKLTDLTVTRNVADLADMPPARILPGIASISASATAAAGGQGNPQPRAPIDFLTGEATGIRWMTPLLLPLVNRKSPAREQVNVVMQLAPDAPCGPVANVRIARDSDIPALNRWRRLYKEERGVLFDADMDALVQNQSVFVYEIPGSEADVAATSGQPGGGGGGVTGGGGGAVGNGVVAAVAKIDLELQNLVEIGGVFTFPEYRQRGYGAGIMRDLAWRVRQRGKQPRLSVDEQNVAALRLYESTGWRAMGKWARVWLTE